VSTQILIAQIGVARPACQISVRRGDITLSLSRDRIRRVYRSVHDPRRKAGDLAAWADAKITVDGGVAGIGYRRAGQDREVMRRTQRWRRWPGQ
jgi:hypothetical protein